MIVGFIKEIKKYIDEWIKKTWRDGKWSTKGDPHTGKNPTLIVLHHKDWILEQYWPATGAGLTTSEAYCECVYFGVAAPGTDKPNDYPDDLMERFLKRLGNLTHNQTALNGYGYKENRNYKPTPAYWNIKDETLKNWNRYEFRKKFENEAERKEMAKELADRLCELAETLDGMKEFREILRSSKASQENSP